MRKSYCPLNNCPMTADAPLGETPRPQCLPNDGRCSTWGDPKTALPPQCPLPIN
ncbi:hypothetical protein [Tolypothrix sp. VBCCA 56010]|uniref:hypothetical protein n=1 Tax=Tolypothrix sp. VBCCA 56010 TaxID=3137731 RepID=UPI003D7E989B